MAEIGNIYIPVVNPLKKVGRPLHYTPEELAEKFVEFVKWSEEHPIVVKKTAVGTTGDTPFNREEEEQKPQYISVKGFLVWLGESKDWWDNLDRLQDSVEFISVKSYIRAYCEDNQAKLASAGLFKENIISRLLGLADKQAVDANVDANVEYKVTFED